MDRKRMKAKGSVSSSRFMGLLIGLMRVTCLYIYIDEVTRYIICKLKGKENKIKQKKKSLKGK